MVALMDNSILTYRKDAILRTRMMLSYDFLLFCINL